MRGDAGEQVVVPIRCPDNKKLKEYFSSSGGFQEESGILLIFLVSLFHLLILFIPDPFLLLPSQKLLWLEKNLGKILSIFPTQVFGIFILPN